MLTISSWQKDKYLYQYFNTTITELVGLYIEDFIFIFPITSHYSFCSFKLLFLIFPSDFYTFPLTSVVIFLGISKCMDKYLFIIFDFSFVWVCVGGVMVRWPPGDDHWLLSPHTQWVCQGETPSLSNKFNLTAWIEVYLQYLNFIIMTYCFKVLCFQGTQLNMNCIPVHI